MRILVVSNKDWHRKYIDELSTRTGSEVIYIDSKHDVNYRKFALLQPDWVFFPHWSYIIPPDVYDNFRCVIFHMTDLPFGRGGSPLQNLIVRGIYETKLSALRCCGALDAGDIYLKRNLSLWGSAEEIYLRSAELSKEMMIEIVRNGLLPMPQQGEAVVFKRRKKEDGNIGDLDSLEQIFDYIRMLDAETYPPAFLCTERFCFEFSRASLKNEYILADVRIRRRKE